MAPLEAALFESGRPVMIAPSAPPQELGRNVLVAWNGSTEQARANAFAVPLLRGAEQVTVLTVEGGTTPGPAGEEVALHLIRNGVPATAVGRAGGAHDRRSDPPLREITPLRSARQRGLCAKPLAPDNIRRGHSSHPGERYLAGPDGALMRPSGAPGLCR